MDETAIPVNSAPAAKKGMNWKLIVIIAVAALLVVGAILLLVFGLGNSKTAPIDVMQKYANAKTVSMESFYGDILAGCEGNNAAKIVKLLKKSETFQDNYTDMEENFADLYEDKVDDYGKNFKITYKNDKSVEEKLDRDDLKDYKSEFKSLGEQFYELSKTMGKLKSSELKDLAEDLEMDVKDLKELIECMKELGQKLKGAEVSDGYDLEVLTVITGSELDDPDEDDFDMTVLKVNGKWISYSNARGLLLSLYNQINSAVSRYL